MIRKLILGALWVDEMDIPRNHKSSSDELGDILRLVQNSFAYMDGRIDPPSSMHTMTLSGISEHCRMGELWTLGDPIVACVFLMPKDNSLYIGKLAVSRNERRRGLAKRLVDHAIDRAVALNKNSLELYTRIELTENHLAFSKMGFEVIAESSHVGYTKPTYIVMRKPVSR